MPVHLATTSATSSASTSSSSMRFLGQEPLLEPGKGAVAQLGRLAEVALARGLVDPEAGLLDLLLHEALQPQLGDRLYLRPRQVRVFLDA